jgi:hypothetical protein
MLICYCHSQILGWKRHKPQIRLMMIFERFRRKRLVHNRDNMHEFSGQQLRGKKNFTTSGILAENRRDYSWIRVYSGCNATSMSANYITFLAFPWRIIKYLVTALISGLIKLTPTESNVHYKLRADIYKATLKREGWHPRFSNQDVTHDKSHNFLTRTITLRQQR